jgi:4-hydroxy-tetrahydrodipicolinate synthase
MPTIFSGAITALITPFKKSAIDVQALEILIERQIQANIEAIVIGGTTGESASLTPNEHIDLIHLAVKIAGDRIAIIAGTGGNNTKSSAELSIAAEKAGVNAIMCVTPYYNKPTQEGLFQHYKTIHDNVGIPIILYSVPHRTGVDFTDETIFRLCDLPNIVAIKDASGNLERPIRLKSRLKDRLTLLTGNDSEAIAFNAVGGRGCISVISNIVPNLCKKMQDLWFFGDHIGALEIQQFLWPLIQALFMESNPICVKYISHLMGLCEAEIRLPLTLPSLTNQEILQNIIIKYSL